MRLKTNLVICAIFVCLGAFVYFHEIEGGKTRDLEAERARQMLDFSDHEVERITIVHPDTTLVVSRSNGDWIIEQPVATGADTEAIERFLRSLRETEVEGEPVQDSASVAADASLLTPYGLDAPRLQVHLGMLEGVAEPLDTIRYGRDTPTQRFTYIQRSGDNPEVRTVRAWRYDNVDKGLFDLRDRRVLHFDRDAVTEIRLKRRDAAGETVISAVRSGHGWWLTEPLSTAGDAASIGDILSRLSNARISSFDHEAPGVDELAATGLTQDAQFIDITLVAAAEGQAPVEQRLLIGARHGRDRYALDVSRPPVFTIDSTVVRSMTKAVQDYRHRTPFAIDAAATTGIDLSVADVLRFSAVKDSLDTWSLRVPEGREAKAWRLNDLITSLRELRVEEFVADAEDVLSLDVASYGFLKPDLRLALHQADSTTVFVEVTDHEGTVYARRADVPTIFRVPASALTDLAPGVDDVAMAPPAADSLASTE